MTDEEISAAISVHQAAIAALEALRLSPVRTSSMAPTISAQTTTRKQPTAPPRWELAVRAFRRFPLEAHTIRRICSAHPEWAVKFTGGVWHVNVTKFDPFADLVERGEASFAVSAMSAKSVAADAQLAISFDQQSKQESEEVTT